MRPGKRERRALREMDRLAQEQEARANAVVFTGHQRGSLDAALKGNTIPSLKREWHYLPARVNGVARHSPVRKVG